MASQREVIRKADIAVSDLVSNGGYLNPMQANKFIEYVHSAPTIVRAMRYVPMNAPKMEINKMGFGSRILKPAPGSGETLAAADRSKVTTEKLTLTTVRTMAEVNIPYDVLEDNIERGRMEDTIMRQIGLQVAEDIEELAIQGDTTSSDTYLALFNGLLKLITTNTTSLAAYTMVEKEIFKTLIKSIDPKYLRNPAAFRFYISHKNETDYRDTLADRIGGRADSLVEGIDAVRSYGIPVIPCAMMPETHIVLTHPLNLIYGIQRDIMIETDKDIRAQSYIIVVSMRLAMQIEIEEATAMGTALAVN